MLSEDRFLDLLHQWNIFSQDLLREIDSGEIELPSALDRRFENLRLDTKAIVEEDVANIISDTYLRREDE